MRVHLSRGLEALHNKISHGPVSKLVNDLLSPLLVTDVDESHYGFNRSEADSLLLVIEHLEEHLKDLHGVEFLADRVYVLLCTLSGFEEADYQHVEEFFSDVPRVAIDEVWKHKGHEIVQSRLDLWTAVFKSVG